MTHSTVLLVEDNPVTRKMMRLTLESQGCTVVEAEDGATAINHLRGPAPDIIVQDLLLPDVDGIELCEQMHEQPGCDTTPVIGVSGHGRRLFSAEADRAGFADRLRKPVEPARLLSAVRALLPGGMRDVPTVPTRILVVDDTDIQRKLTRLRLQESGFDVLEARDGDSALTVARREHPDAVVTDVLMPGLDGFELCRALRADPTTAAIPVVLASSVFIDPADRALAAQAGANGYVTRQPDMATIVDALRRALETTGRARAEDRGYDVLHAERLGKALLQESAAHRSLAAELAQRKAQLSVLAGISQTLARATDPGAVMEDILALCMEATGVQGAEYRAGPGASCCDLGRVTVGEPPAVPPGGPAAGDESGTVVGPESITIALRCDGEDLGVVVLGSPGVPFDREQTLLCQAIAHQLCQAVALARAQAAIVDSRDKTVERLARAVALRDGGTAEHTQRMSVLCHIVARRLGLPPERCDLLRIASAMHDIGKIATPDAILFKEGPLTAQERAEIERHAEIGHTILSGSGSALLELAAAIALNHHERWDGSGYPRRISGEEIPLEARIAAVADVFDALTSDRPYRPAMPLQDALGILSAGRGSHFDPAVLDAFMASLGEIAPLVAT